MTCPIFNHYEHRQPGMCSKNDEVVEYALSRTVGFWAYFDDTAAKQWLDACLMSRSAIVRYLASLVSVSDDSGGVREFIQVASFENLISVEELEGRINRYLNGELVAEEAELVKLFRKGVKKRRRQVWVTEDETDWYRLLAKRYQSLLRNQGRI